MGGGDAKKHLKKKVRERGWGKDTKGHHKMTQTRGGTGNCLAGRLWGKREGGGGGGWGNKGKDINT